MSFSRFLRAVQAHDRQTLDALGSRYVEWDITSKSALSSQAGTTGGFLVPTDHHALLASLAAQRSIVRPRATLIPMSAGECDVPLVDAFPTPTPGESPLLSGVSARWTEEATQPTEFDPTFKQAHLVSHELSGLCKLANSLSADAQEAVLLHLFANALAWHEDYAFLRGDGSGKPLGVLSWPGLIAVPRSAASAVALPDLSNMLARLLPPDDPSRVVWAAHPTTLPKLLQIGGALTHCLDPLTGRPRRLLLGHDLFITDKLPTLNALGDVLLMDLSHYLLGDRQQLLLAHSTAPTFYTNQGVWRFATRVAGQPWPRSSITLADATNTASPFVALAPG